MDYTHLGPLTTTFTTATNVDCQSTFAASNPNVDSPWLQKGPVDGIGHVCLPPNYERGWNYYYSPGVCFEGYTYATASQGSSSDSVFTGVCCPSDYDYRSSEDLGGRTLAAFCTSLVTDAETLTLMYYEWEPNGGDITFSTTTKTTIEPGQKVDAYGIVVQSAPGDPIQWPDQQSVSFITTTVTTDGPEGSPSAMPETSVTMSSSSASSSITANIAEEGDGMTTAAKAGIAAGAIGGALLVLGCVYVAYRIGVDKRRQQQQENSDGSSSRGHSDKMACATEDEVPPEGVGWLHEMGQGLRRMPELEAPRRILEMGDDEAWRSRRSGGKGWSGWE